MTIRAWLPTMAAIGLGVDGRLRVPQPEGADAEGPAVRPRRRLRRSPPAPAPVDPITALITTSQQHFDAGERELKVGHLDRARSEFDRALDVLLESPYGARTEPACARISIVWWTESTHRR